MAQPGSVLKTISLEEFQRQLGRLVREVASGESRIIIHQGGEPLVRLEPAISTEQRTINAMMADSDFRDLAAISEALKDIPLDELEAQIAKALDEGKERRRRDRERSSRDS